MAIPVQLFVTMGQDELSPPPHFASVWPTVAFVFTVQIPLLVLPTRGLLCSCAEIQSGWVQWVQPRQIQV